MLLVSLMSLVPPLLMERVPCLGALGEPGDALLPAPVSAPLPAAIPVRSVRFVLNGKRERQNAERSPQCWIAPFSLHRLRR